MSHEYDLFERFPDGSSLWRACVFGRENARVQLQGLAQGSPNQFYAINVVSGAKVFAGFQHAGFPFPQKLGKRSRTAAA